MEYSRREFLKYMAMLGGGAALASCKPFLKPGNPAPEYSYTVPEWSGDNPVPMHKIRDWYRRGKFPTMPPPSKSLDMVIIGGGLSGLALAYYCKDESFLLLEREAELGGNAKSGTFGDITYAKGSAYLVDIEEPYGALYESLGLALKPVAKPDNMFLASKGSKSWESFDQKSGQEELYADYQRLKHHMAMMLERPDFPSLPLQQATPEMLKYDNGSFYDYLKNDYSKALLEYVDSYCWSALGGGIEQISAYAGINFYSEIAGDIYAFPGGNAAVAKKLAESVFVGNGKERLKTNVSVVRVDDKGDNVWVTYMDNQTNELTTVSAKQAVMATPFFIAARILNNLEKSIQDILLSCQYGSYAVANFCFDEVPGNGKGQGTRHALPGYDHWLPQPNMNGKTSMKHQLTDFIIADWVSTQRHKPGEKKPFVITTYAPFKNPAMGRGRMLSEQPGKLASELNLCLGGVVHYQQPSLKEIRMTRYGHQLLRSEVGLIKRLATMPKQFGRIHFCHSDGQGMAAIESAVIEASWLSKTLLR